MANKYKKTNVLWNNLQGRYGSSRLQFSISKKHSVCLPLQLPQLYSGNVNVNLTLTVARGTSEQYLCT